MRVKRVCTQIVRISGDSTYLNYCSVSKGDSVLGTIMSGKNEIQDYSSNSRNNLFLSFGIWHDGKNNKVLTNETIISNMKRLQEIRSLRPDWNGYGADCFSGELIDICENIVESLKYQPQIYPTGRNSIQLQFELDDRSYLEFEVFADRVMCIQVPQRVYSKASFAELKKNDLEEINNIVKKFYG